MDIVIDTGIGIVANTSVKEIAENAVIVSAQQFTNTENWWSLVKPGTWIPVKAQLDTALFSDALECKMGHVQIEQTRDCKWDRSKLMARDDFPNGQLWRAIPCDEGMHYVVGHFAWR